MSERFYINCPLQPGLVTLEGGEARHLATVCRLRPGDAVCLFNGDGHEYPARVTLTEKRHVELDVVERVTPARELGFHMEVAAPLPKGDRAQFLVEKLTELGVARFVPLKTEHSVVHPGDAKLEKLERYVIEASKQCGRNVLMKIAGLADWREYCQNGELPRMRYLGQPGGSAKTFKTREAAVCAVGPEGGFTEKEVQAAQDAGWQMIDLGSRILRVETAAVVMASGVCICPE